MVRIGLARVNFISQKYSEDPKESGQQIFDHIANIYPIAKENQIRKVLGIGADTKMPKKK